MTSTMTFRQLRWLVTLYRHGRRGGNCPLSAWKHARTRTTLALCLLLAVNQAHAAATLRPYGQLATPTVHLSDLFDDLGTTPDRALGQAPAPGATIIVQAAQLAAIARDYGVDWRPESGSERITLERQGVRMTQADFLQPLRTALTDMGAPADGELSVPGFEPPLLPKGINARPSVTDTNFDPTSGRFTALISLATPDMPSITTRVSGQVVAVMQAAVLTHHVHQGSILRAEDLRSARVHTSLLRGNVPISIEVALGQALRHDLPPGQPLTVGDVARPVLVPRNSAVHMVLDAGEISLSAQGLALEEGGLGETVRVQNPSSKVVVLAMVLGAGEVRVLPQRARLELAAQ